MGRSTSAGRLDSSPSLFIPWELAFWGRSKIFILVSLLVELFVDCDLGKLYSKRFKLIRCWLPAIKRGRFLALLVIVVTSLRTIVYAVHMPLKFSGLNGDWNHDLVDACAVLNQLSYQANSELGPVSRKSRGLFGPETPVVKLQSACLASWFFNMILM